MEFKTMEIEVETSGELDMVDITEQFSGLATSSGVQHGVASAFVLSTTSSLIICENEKGLLEDLKAAFKNIAPDERGYEHNKAWGDNNGRSHVRATISGQDVTIPVRNGKLLLGTWQSLFLVEFDLRPRKRRVALSIIGK